MNRLPNLSFGVLILAGGKSSRMGRDKSQLSYGGQPLLEHMRQIAKASGAQTVLIGGGTNADVQDTVAEAGPVASLCGLAAHTATQDLPHWIIIPVDMPLLTPALLQRLLLPEVGAVHFADQPLPMMVWLDVAARQTLRMMEDRLHARQTVALRDIPRALNATILLPMDEERTRLINANTPGDWQALLAQSE